MKNSIGYATGRRYFKVHSTPRTSRDLQGDDSMRTTTHFLSPLHMFTSRPMLTHFIASCVHGDAVAQRQVELCQC